MRVTNILTMDTIQQALGSTITKCNHVKLIMSLLPHQLTTPSTDLFFTPPIPLPISILQDWTTITEKMKSLATLTGMFSMAVAQSWPNGPFTTSGRDILDASGNVVTYAGANWPGAADVMIPEGLQYQSVANIVAKLKEVNMNVIRLTYAIEMIDQIYENDGKDVPLSQAFVEALGEINGTTVYNQVLTANPDFSPNITRLEVRPGVQ